LILVCGHYEGGDERVMDWIDGEVSLGDYVLSGGEPAAAVVVDSLARLLPGVVGDERSVREDSFFHGLLDHPHYTRPRSFKGRDVPEVLMSGDHAKIARWRKAAALRNTLRKRPDLLDKADLDPETRRILEDMRRESEEEKP
jgi:tRNA (guanine37-N1)-methyltransferase